MSAASCDAPPPSAHAGSLPAASSFSPAKSAAAFRVYDGNAGVRAHYAAMRANQTLAFVERQLAAFAPRTFGVRPVSRAGAGFLAAAGVPPPPPGAGLACSIRDMFAVLRSFVDASDPDTDAPNVEHMMQSAERARAAGEPEWLQLAALLHDMGKAIFVFSDGAANGMEGMDGTRGGAQWALGGDTWVVGCRIPDCALYPELSAGSPDAADAVLGSEDGIYAPGCGLDALQLAFGHDEYMALWLQANENSLPPAARAIFRYHSCYPLHTGGAYARFLAPGDAESLDWVRRFNQYDLYSKADARPDVQALWPYYQRLIEQFFPASVQKW